MDFPVFSLELPLGEKHPELPFNPLIVQAADAPEGGQRRKTGTATLQKRPAALGVQEIPFIAEYPSQGRHLPV